MTRIRDLSDEYTTRAPVVGPSSPAAAATSDRAVAREMDDYCPTLWDELERVVGYRITDENFESALVEAVARRSRSSTTR